MPEFPARKLSFPGRRLASFLTGRPGGGSKPLSVSGSIRLRALLDGRGISSSRPLGLAPGESAVSPYPVGASDAASSPYRRAVSFLLRCSGSRPAGSHPPPRFPERGLSSAVGRCQHDPPSAALHLLADRDAFVGGKALGPGSFFGPRAPVGGAFAPARLPALRLALRPPKGGRPPSRWRGRCPKRNLPSRS